MGSLKPIAEREAQGEAARVYAEIREALGISFVPNFFKTLANSPTALRGTWEAYRNASWRGSVPTVLKEMMFVAISSARKCHYCEVARKHAPRSSKIWTSSFPAVAATRSSSPSRPR